MFRLPLSVLSFSPFVKQTGKNDLQEMTGVKFRACLHAAKFGHSVLGSRRGSVRVFRKEEPSWVGRRGGVLRAALLWSRSKAGLPGAVCWAQGVGRRLGLRVCTHGCFVGVFAVNVGEFSLQRGSRGGQIWTWHNVWCLLQHVRSTWGCLVWSFWRSWSLQEVPAWEDFQTN